ncbi:KAD [Hepatospora eriocheir]|uniref:KAD n=1 Tax=Hepatospora eriocheir TaxID=1081669 RepID=A0A1X0Q8Y6_9MICR|nr:KAD [Hepatospora eriocheir]
MEAIYFSFIGKPGCGKSTILKQINEEYHVNVIFLGEELRKRKLVNGSDLLSTEKLECILEEMIKGIKQTHADKKEITIIFDGFPRTLSQISGKFPLKSTFVINIDENVAKERINNRKGNRNDDKDNKVIEERFKKFFKETQPAIENLKSLDLVIEIDGNKSKEEVYKKVKDVIEEKKYFKKKI